MEPQAHPFLHPRLPLTLSLPQSSIIPQSLTSTLLTHPQSPVSALRGRSDGRGLLIALSQQIGCGGTMRGQTIVGVVLSFFFFFLE